MPQGKPVPAKKTTPKTLKKSATTRKPLKRSPAHRSRLKKKTVRSDAPYALLSALLILILVGLGRFAYAQYEGYVQFRTMRDAVASHVFYTGIFIDELDVSGLTLDEALRRLSDKDAARRDALRISVVSGDRQWSISPDDLEYRSNYASVARHAYQAGRVGSLEERYDAIQATGSDPLRYAVSYGYDKDLLRATTDAICEELSIAPVEASIAGFDAKSRTFTFKEGKRGIVADADALYQKALAAIASQSGASTVIADTRTVNPTRTTEALMDDYGEIASAVTNASSSSSNRLSNIRQALSLIHGTRLEPGATFSFNGTVGQRTTARGFQLAGAFENGETTEAVGGGICQVSTTLFNAAVKSNLAIVERSPHSRPVAYVDKGKDAAVDWPGTDLQFRNPTDEPIYLVAYLSQDKRVHVSIYGRKLEDGQYIRVETQTTETLYPGPEKVTVNRRLASGERIVVSAARTGYKAVAYKVYYRANGSVIRREELCRSTYASAAAVVEVGP